MMQMLIKKNKTVTTTVTALFLVQFSYIFYWQEPKRRFSDYSILFYNSNFWKSRVITIIPIIS